MTTLAFVTPSYAPDYELCCDLHASLMSTMPPSVVHHIVTPDSDVALFRGLEGPQCRIWTLSDLMPRRYRKLPRVNAWLNLRHPWPPVRGWVMQQIVKLSIASRVDADVFVLVDSDVVVVRPVSPDTFITDGKPSLYRQVDAIDTGLARHRIWHDVARELLGLPPADEPLNDYVNALTVWDPAIVAALQSRIESVTGRPWMDAIGARLHFSEDILYGVYVDEVLERDDRHMSVRSPCRCYWDTQPLGTAEAAEFALSLGADDVAVMISAKSHTPLEARRGAWREVERVLRATHA